MKEPKLFGADFQYHIGHTNHFSNQWNVGQVVLVLPPRQLTDKV